LSYINTKLGIGLNIYSMARAWYALTLRSECQRSRSRGYEVCPVLLAWIMDMHIERTT